MMMNKKVILGILMLGCAVVYASDDQNSENTPFKKSSVQVPEQYIQLPEELKEKVSLKQFNKLTQHAYPFNVEDYLPLSSEQINAIALITETVIGDALHPDDYSKFLNVCRDFTPKRIASISEEAISLFDRYRNLEDVLGGGYLMWGCLSLTAAQAKALLDDKASILVPRNTCEIVYDEDEEDAIADVISACVCLTFEQINALVAHGTQYFSDKTLGRVRSSIIEDLSFLTPEEITEFAPYAKDFGLEGENIPTKQRRKTINQFFSIPSEERAETINLIKGHLTEFFPEDIVEEGRAYIFRNFFDYPPDQIKESIEQLKKYLCDLLPQNVTSAEKVAIFKICLQLYPELIERVSQTTKGLLEKSKDWYSKAHLLKDCVKLSRKQTLVIIDYADFLFTRKMKFEQRFQITEACVPLTPEQISARINAIKKHMGDLLIGWDEAGRAYNTAKCLELMPEEIEVRLKTLKEQSKILFIGDIAIEHRRGLVEACIPLTPEQISARIKAIKEHMENLLAGCGEEERTYIIRGCLKLMPEELEARIKAIKEQAENLFVEKNKKEWSPFIILACLQLNPDQISEVAKNTKGLLDNTLSWYNKSCLIVDCAELTQPQTCIVAKYAADIFKKDTLRGDRSHIIKALQKLSPEQMESVIKKLIECKENLLTYDFTDGMPKSEHSKAIADFIAAQAELE
jgi:3,4-dihydroxy-2-butanone 4-phosphate synthase